LHETTVSRRKIARYHTVRLLLLDAFQKIFSSDQFVKDDISRVFCDMAERVQKIQNSR
jgi:hypothetical protein